MASRKKIKNIDNNPTKRITLNTDIVKLEKIFHISDIHIRNLKRHVEYKEIFEKIYNQINEIGTKNSLIFLGGDMAHSKNEMSPELIDLIGDFLEKLSELAPVIIITGNHDTNLSNPSRLDVISPIVKLMKNSKIHYLKDSGIYDFADVSFAVMSVFDESDNYIKAKDFEAKTKIALYHGTLNNTKTDFGFSLSGTPLKMFDGYDMVLLGDIHKRQILQSAETIGKEIKPTLEYPGSCIQQNYAEELEHGFLVWNMRTKTSMFTPIQNDYAYLTLDVVDGKIPIIKNIPAKPRIRVRIKDTKSSEINQILSVIRKKYNPIELSTLNLDPINFRNLKITDEEIIGNVRDVNLQNKLFYEYLKTKHFLNDELLEEIKNINEEINNKLPKVDIIRNIRFKIKKLEFSNMFSYGENNYIDFSDMNGIMGIMGVNSSGKSSLLSIMLYCLFDKSERAFRGIDILNSSKDNFYCKINFAIEGKDYFIERIGTKVYNKKRNISKVKVDVNFWTADETGEIVSLNGEERDRTNARIREYIGTYENFVLTSMSLQNKFYNFIEMGQTDRKDILVAFLDIGIFNQLYDIAKNDISWIQETLSEYEKTDYPKILAELETELQKNKVIFAGLIKDKKRVDEERDKINTEIRGLVSKLISIDMPKKTLEELEEEKIELENIIEKEKDILKKYKEQFEEFKQEYIKHTKKLNEFDVKEVEENYQKYKSHKENLNLSNLEITKIKTEVDSKIEKLKHLSKHEYDPNCKYCMNNIFVKDAIKTKQLLDEDYVTAKRLVDENRSIQSIVDIYEKYDSLQQIINEIKRSIDGVKNDTIKLKNKINDTDKNLIVLENNLIKIKETIIKFKENIKNIEHNKKINSLISEQDKKLSTVINEIKTLDKQIIEINSKVQISESEKKKLLSDMERIKILELKYEAYNYYLEATANDGIPYELVARVIPDLQEEINNILKQIVDFSILLELDGKNVNTRIYYGEDRQWALETGGGMEKFVSSIAIRTALVNFSNLPRPNFLAIDEGFSNQDPEVMNQMPILFEFLRTQFDFVLCISHNMVIKDMVDDVITASKKDEFSYIRYE